MPDATPVVTCFLRHQGEVLLLKRASTRDTYPNHWAGVSGYLEHDDPVETARMEIREEVGLIAPELIRTGTPVEIEDEDDDEATGRSWRVYPFLFDVDTRDIDPNREHATVTWVAPTEMLRRPTVPGLWRAYRRIAPTAETIAADTEHGSAAISIQALEALRDRAGELAVEDGSIADVQAEAERLLDTHPSMAALRNRINRAMYEASTPAAVESAAIAGIKRALGADIAAAHIAAETIAGDRVLTLSRSGTVLAALQEGAESVVVAESRPAREGITVAETLLEADIDVTVCTDAAMATLLADADPSIEVVMVGADTVLADGRLVNKTGTRSVALAAAHENVPLYVVAAQDKIAATTTPTLTTGPNSAVYDGDADLAVTNPTFDVTPAVLIDAVITEDGRLSTDAIRMVADEHRSIETWFDPDDED